MASEADHISLANHNDRLLLHLLKDINTFPGWVATIAFYKAIHVVEAVFAHQDRVHSASHTDREMNLKRAKYSAIFVPYEHLNTASRIARYLESQGKGGFRTFTDYMTADHVKILIRKKLHLVEQESLSFLSDRGESLTKMDPTAFK